MRPGTRPSRPPRAPGSPRFHPRGALLGLALVGVLTSLACTSSGPREPSREQKLGLYFENALRYYDLRDLDRAQHQVERGLALDPRNERFLLMLGKIQLHRGRTEDVLAAERLFRRHPGQDDYRVKLGLGEALERKGVLQDEAARAIRSGDRYTDHPDPEARADELARQAQESWEEAYRQYERAVSIHSGEIDATNGLIRTAGLLGRHQVSVEWCRVLIGVLQDSTRVRRLELEDVSIEASRERQLREAIADNTEMIVKTHEYIAEVYYGLGLKEEVIEELGPVLELEPDRAGVYSRRAQVFYELGRYLKAKESIDRFIKLSADRPFDDPDVRAAYRLQGKCQAALANADLAPGH